MNTQRHIFAATCLLSLILACSSDPMYGEHLRQTSQPLWSSSTTNYWPGGEVEVCFQPFTQADYDAVGAAASYSTTTTRIKNVVEAAFEGISGSSIDFVGWQDCDDWEDFKVGQKPGEVRVLVRTVSEADNFAVRYATGVATIANRGDVFVNRLGYQSDKEAVVGTALNAYSLWNGFDTGILHELAHVLGFGHEYLRSDNIGQCRPGSAGSTGDFITSYDEDSIMNATYCHWKPRLSELDRVGLAFIYSSSFTARPVRAENALYGGYGVIRRSGSSILPDLVWRGISTSMFADADWFVDGQLVSQSVTFDPNIAGEAVVRAVHTDIFGNERTTGSTSVITDDSLHTAVLSSFL